MTNPKKAVKRVKELTTHEIVLRDIAFQTGRMLESARYKAGLTQKELAKLIKSSQVVISRVENGSELPSLKWLNNVAWKLNTHLIPPMFATIARDKEPHYPRLTKKRQP